MTATTVKLSDMPSWVRAAIREHLGSSRPTCRIIYTSRPDIGPVWHEACCRHLIARRADGQTVCLDSGYYDSLPNAPSVQQMAYFGGAMSLPPTGALLELLTLPKRATLYLHPAAAPATLPDHVILTDPQYRVLEIVGTLVSSYRPEAYREAGIRRAELGTIIEALQEQGLLDRRRAITIRGRNVLARAASRNRA